MIPVTRLLVVALLFAPSLALAQAAKDSAKETTKPAPEPGAAAAPVPSTPEQTTASFGDWVLRCERTPSTPHRICEVAHALMLQGQTAPIAQVAFGRRVPNEPKRLTMTVVLPTNIAFASKPQAMIGKGEATPIELTWQRCVPGACFASTLVNDDTLITFGAQTAPGKLLFRDAADRGIALPLSFRGLTQALAALAKEP